MLCLKKRRTYSFTQDACAAIPRQSKEDNNQYERSLNMTITTLPRKNRNREERPSRMVLTVTEDTPADMLTGSMELLVQLPRDHHLHTHKVTVLRSTPMMDLLVQIATAHKLTASNYNLQAIGERDLILPHHPNTPIGALDALQVKLLSKQGTCVAHKSKQANQPFETTFRLQVHLPRNQLYVSRVSPKMNLGEILNKVCREKNLDRSKYELRHPVNLEETLELSLSLQDYHLQEVTLYAKQTRSLGSTLSTQNIIALQRQEERRQQQTKQSVFGFMFKKSKENSLSMDSLGARSVSPARSDETARSVSPLQPPARPQRKRRPAPKPPANAAQTVQNTSGDSGKDKMTINHSRNSSDSSGYHEASVLSDNPDSAARLPETLPRRSKAPSLFDASRKLAQTSQSSKSLGNLTATHETLSRGINSTFLSSTGLRKKRAAPPPPTPRPLSLAISTQALEGITDSEKSLTSDIEPSKPSSDIGALSKASSDIDCPKVNSNIGINAQSMRQLDRKLELEIAPRKFDCGVQQNCTTEANPEARSKSDLVNSEVVKAEVITPVEATPKVEQARVATKRVYQDIPSETDILLQKVSDSLSLVLPTSSSPVPETSLPLETSYTTTSMQTNVTVPNDSVIELEPIETKNKSNELYRSCIDFSVKNGLSASTPNITTANSQQDTSDYVSAMGEDLSISDWEYQLPAPPSAFRDSLSSIFNDYDTVTLTDTIDSSNKNSKSTKNLLNNVGVNCDQEALKEKIDLVSEKEIDIKQKPSKFIVKQALISSQKSETDSDLRKQMISELENKIETGTLAQFVNKDFDRRNIYSLSAPKLAPVDNTLSNFTITTYTRQKSLDIFEELEQESSDCTRNSEEKFIKTFAMLSRNNTGACNYDKRSATRNTYLINNLLHSRKATNKSEELNTNNVDYKIEPKIRDQGELHYKWQFFNATNDKTNIQRSKSYISMTNNTKYQKEAQGINMRKHEPQIESEITGIKKSTSITDLNVETLRDNCVKFSQWRDNILKNQEEPTKEKQLQSLQVLKSILPQLKNAQQAQENTSKDYNNALPIQRTNRYEAESNEYLLRMNAVAPHKSRGSLSSECEPSVKEESTKRYVYTGPPAISLGSWSERPCVNVQIKTDIDYTLGRSNTTNDNKTIVNINSMKNEKDVTNYTYSSTGKNNVTKHKFNIDSLTNENPDELIAKKLIAHTTASNFKLSNRVNKASNLTKNKDRPVVMGVELKRTSVKTKEILKSEDENEVDTTSMNFKELTKTFGQYGNFKQKPKRSNINKSSEDYRNVQQSEIDRITNLNVKENGYAWFTKATNQNNFLFKNQPETQGVQQNSRLKKFTSVIGVNETSQNLELQSEMSLRCNINNAIKINPPMPVVKGFKIHTTADSKINNNQMSHNGLSMVDSFNKNVQFSKPQTMPVITGVMLKNANVGPKTIPVQLDPRDMLLESIRNFGGHKKLKNVIAKLLYNQSEGQ
ncbi:uncharacterized protein LOC143903155 isoform X17 [Temnothorax americanus]|uniref:uncharacterized protein LOC143903155 isoform X17 n=1 Tax=Temnothorax americanus TaxID=1964332 RepID=UPI0040676E62